MGSKNLVIWVVIDKCLGLIMGMSNGLWSIVGKGINDVLWEYWIGVVL